MKKLICNTSLTFIFLFTAVVSVFSQSDQELKQKIEKINKEMSQAMVDGNYAASLSYYTSDAMSLPNNAPMLEGIDAIRKSNEDMLKMGAKFKSFETKTLHVKSCEKMITEIGTYKMSMTIPGMASDYEDHGKYMTIWEKQSDGSLKVKLEMWNTDVNPMAMGQQ